MADNARVARLADRIKVLLAERLDKGLRDPRLGFVTITDVRVTGDLQHASVFYTVLGSEEEREGSAQALKSATGMLRSELGKQLNVRLIPSIEFIADAIPENAGQIADLLREARERDAAVAGLAATATYAGDADPYVKPREYAEDDEDDEDEGSVAYVETWSARSTPFRTNPCATRHSATSTRTRAPRAESAGSARRRPLTLARARAIILLGRPSTEGSAMLALCCSPRTSRTATSRRCSASRSSSSGVGPSRAVPRRRPVRRRGAAARGRSSCRGPTAAQVDHQAVLAEMVAQGGRPSGTRGCRAKHRPDLRRARARAVRGAPGGASRRSGRTRCSPSSRWSGAAALVFSEEARPPVVACGILPSGSVERRHRAVGAGHPAARGRRAGEGPQPGPDSWAAESVHPAHPAAPGRADDREAHRRRAGRVLHGLGRPRRPLRAVHRARLRVPAP